MSLELFAIQEDQPGAQWRRFFEVLWPAYKKWFLREGDQARPTYAAGFRALKHHMPELVPVYERLVELAGGDDLAARCLSLYRPTPYMASCSQAVWTRGEPVLIRNYDYRPELWERAMISSVWSGRQVIAMSDCLWGVLDGLNADGLAVSLAFGGRKTVGDGFGTPLLLRYLLESCDNVEASIQAMRRVPVNMAYNVTCLDATGAFVTAYLSPDRLPLFTHRPIATNHQRRVEWHAYAEVTASVEREQYLASRLEDPGETLDRLTRRFLEPPLYTENHRQKYATLYTALYRPRSGTVQFLWPFGQLEQSFKKFRSGRLVIE